VRNSYIKAWRLLSGIDLHHGEYSRTLPYSSLNIIGVAWSEEIQEELNKFGFHEHDSAQSGFVTRREPDDTTGFYGMLATSEPIWQ